MDHLLKRKFIIFDLETLSTEQTGVIVQIGAVKFTIEEGINSQFLVNIDPYSCIEFGLTVEKSTVEWWKTQPKEVRDSWKINQQTLPDSLNKFNEWVGSDNDSLIGANGIAFDCGIIRNAYEVCKIERNWKYFNEFDIRTVGLLLNMRLSSGNTHNALEDSTNQAEQFIKLFKE